MLVTGCQSLASTLPSALFKHVAQGVSRSLTHSGRPTRRALSIAGRQSVRQNGRQLSRPNAITGVQPKRMFGVAGSQRNRGYSTDTMNNTTNSSNFTPKLPTELEACESGFGPGYNDAVFSKILDYHRQSPLNELLIMGPGQNRYHFPDSEGGATTLDLSPMLGDLIRHMAPEKNLLTCHVYDIDTPADLITNSESYGTKPVFDALAQLPGIEKESERQMGTASVYYFRDSLGSNEKPTVENRMFLAQEPLYYLPKAPLQMVPGIYEIGKDSELPRKFDAIVMTNVFSSVFSKSKFTASPDMHERYLLAFRHVLNALNPSGRLFVDLTTMVGLTVPVSPDAIENMQYTNPQLYGMYLTDLDRCIDDAKASDVEINEVSKKFLAENAARISTHNLMLQVVGLPKIGDDGLPILNSKGYPVPMFPESDLINSMNTSLRQLKFQHYQFEVESFFGGPQSMVPRSFASIKRNY